LIPPLRIKRKALHGKMKRILLYLVRAITTQERIGTVTYQHCKPGDGVNQSQMKWAIANTAIDSTPNLSLFKTATEEK